jgi:hypothetical protein
MTSPLAPMAVMPQVSAQPASYPRPLRLNIS